MKKVRIAVLASGTGSNMVAIATQLARLGDESPAEIALVVSNRSDSGALKKARELGIDAAQLSNHGDGAAVLGQLQDAAVSLIVLAGYTRLVPATVVRAFEGRVLNIHPALLPAFGGTGMYGTRVHAAVLASGATVSGATVHMVTEEYDRGSIIAQWPVPVLPRDTPATLAQRVLAVEHILYPLVVVDAAERILRNRTTGPDAAPYSNVAAGQDNSVASNDTAAAAQALARSGQEAFLLSDADPAELNRQIASTIRNRQITRYHKGG